MKETRVSLRKEKTDRTVRITSSMKPEIPPEVLDKWQALIDAAADLLEVPAGLIMRITEEHMEVFLKSQTEGNPYPEDGKDTLGNGLYCETVIGHDAPLHIENALHDADWKDNPDVEKDMISYYGLPLKWHDGEFFGTICVLDDRAHTYSKRHRSVLERFKEAIETDLYNLELIERLRRAINTDALIGAASRRWILSLAETWLNEEETPFCTLVLDVDEFKAINDNHGHAEGDQVLEALVGGVRESLDEDDHIGRLGGDEFLVLMKGGEGTCEESAQEMKKRIESTPELKRHDITVSVGAACSEETPEDVEQLLALADKRMFAQKRSENVAGG